MGSKIKMTTIINKENTVLDKTKHAITITCYNIKLYYKCIKHHNLWCTKYKAWDTEINEYINDDWISSS